MTNNLNSVLPFAPINNFDGTLEEMNDIMITEMYEAKKKLGEMKAKKNEKTLEEQAKAIEKKFKRSQSLYEEYDPAKFETKARVDLLFFEHLCQNLPEIENMELLIGKFYRTTKSLYEMVNMKPETHKMLSTNLLVESYDDQQETFRKIVSEHINNNYYRVNPKERKEKFLTESQEYATMLIEKGLDSDQSIQIAVKASLMESLIRNVAIPKFVQKRIKYLCEDQDYGKVFDQDHLKNLWEEFNLQTKQVSRVIAAAI